jgi:2-hydroxy-3-keto-5-methylthiopentenyl-1-phosphate phosphatase
MALFIDFDGTITTKDTISTLAAACLHHHAGTEPGSLTEKWAYILDAYSKDCEEFSKDYEPPENLRDTVAEEASFLEGLRSVEQRSIARLEESRICNGCDSAFLHAAGRAAVEKGDVVVRPGFRQFCAYSVAQGWKVTVVSVNWSRAFIRGVLEAGLQEDYLNVAVVSNEILSDGQIVGPALLNSAEHDRALTTSSDKRRVVEKLASRIEVDGSNAQSLSRTMYFGDSLTDLESLIHCSMGFVMADKDDSKLLQTLPRLGYTALHISGVTFPLPPQCVVWSRDFEQVLASSFFMDAIASLKPHI